MFFIGITIVILHQCVTKNNAKIMMIKSCNAKNASQETQKNFRHEPPTSGTFGRRRLGAGHLNTGHLGAWTIGRQVFFLASFFCSYVVSACSSLRSR